MVRRLYVDLRPACMQRSATPCLLSAARDRPCAAHRRCCRGSGRNRFTRPRGWGRRGWLGMVPHHAVLRRQSARLCLDLHAAGLAWVGAQAAASAERWRARWRANLSAQVCEDAAERVMQAGSAGAACAAQAQLRLPLRRPPLRESEQACMRRARTLPARVALPLASCLIGQRLRECCWAAWRSGPAAEGPGVLRASGCASMLCGCSEGAPGRRRLFGERLGIFVSRLPLQCLSTSQCHRNAETLVTLKVAGKLRVFPALTSQSDGFFTTIPAAPRARSSCCYGICRSLTLLLHRRWRQPARERGPDSNTWPGTARADASASGLWIRPPSYCASS